MPGFDPSGNFTRAMNWQQDRDNGIRILADRHDAEDNNFASAFNQVFLRNGVVPMTGDLNMGGKRINTIAAGTELLPGLAFELNIATGIYQLSPNVLGITCNGTKRLEINTNGIGVFGGFLHQGAGFTRLENTNGGAVPAGATGIGLELSKQAIACYDRTGAVYAPLTVHTTSMTINACASLNISAPAASSLTVNFQQAGIAKAAIFWYNTDGVVYFDNMTAGYTFRTPGQVKVFEIKAAGVDVTGNITATGNLVVNGSTALGDAAGDTHTFNGTPNFIANIANWGMQFSNSNAGGSGFYISAGGPGRASLAVNNPVFGALFTVVQEKITAGVPFDPHGGVFMSGSAGAVRLQNDQGVMTGQAGIGIDIAGRAAGSVALMRAYNATTALNVPLSFYATAFTFLTPGTTAAAANAVLDGSNNLLKSTSARRYKADIEGVETKSAKDIILGLHPITYRSLADADNPLVRHYGFIAEDVETVEPRLVTYVYNAKDWRNIAKKGEPEVLQVRKGAKAVVPDGVQYERLIVPLIAYIQELEARLQAAGI